MCHLSENYSGKAGECQNFARLFDTLSDCFITTLCVKYAVEFGLCLEQHRHV